jgi:hypothetical protein
MDVFQRLKLGDKEAERQAVLDFIQDRNNRIATYGTPQGQRELRRLLESSHFFQTTIVGKPDTMAWGREFERNKILSIVAPIPGVLGSVLSSWLSEMEHEIVHHLQEVIDHG